MDPDLDVDTVTIDDIRAEMTPLGLALLGEAYQAAVNRRLRAALAEALNTRTR